MKVFVEIENNPDENRWAYRKVNTVPSGGHFEDDGEYEVDLGIFSRGSKRYRKIKPDATAEHINELLASTTPRLDLEDAYTEQITAADLEEES